MKEFTDYVIFELKMVYWLAWQRLCEIIILFYFIVNYFSNQSEVVVVAVVVDLDYFGSN